MRVAIQERNDLNGHSVGVNSRFRLCTRHTHAGTTRGFQSTSHEGQGWAARWFQFVSGGNLVRLSFVARYSECFVALRLQGDCQIFAALV